MESQSGDAADEPEPTVERWVFGGTRVGQGNRRIHEWIGPGAERLHYKASGSYAVGSVYEVRVVRRDDGGVTKYGTPRYAGEQTADTELFDELAARHRAAEVTLGLAARERAAKRHDPVEVAITRLADLAARVPPSQRVTFATYVSTRLIRAWSRRS